MIRKILIKIIKVWEMVRNRTGGVFGGVADFGGGKLFKINIYSFEVFYQIIYINSSFGMTGAFSNAN